MDGKVVIGTELDTKSFDEEIKQTEEKLNRLENSYNKALQPKDGLKPNEQQLKELRFQIEQTSNKLVDLKRKQEEAQQKVPSSLLEWIKNFGKETEKNVKRVARWTLALIGIRGVVSLISRSLNTLSQYDEQLATDVQYLQFVLATTLKPVIEYLVQLAFKLMSYVGYISKAWFGVSVFANASAEAMNKTSKSAEKVKKQLAGFDEMNILSDSGSDEESTNATLPSMDLSQQNIEPPKWLIWIGDHGKEIISLISGIAGALILLSTGLTITKSLGIGVAIAGVVYSISALLDYLKAPTWENFGKIIQGIGIFVIGLGIAFFGLPAIIAGVAVLIVGTVIKYWDKIKSFLQNGIDWLKEKSDWVHRIFGDNIGKIYDNIVENFQAILNGFNDVFNGIKTILDGIIMFVKGVFTGNWKMAWEGVKKIFSGIFTALGGIVQTALTIIINSVANVARGVGQIIYEILATVVNGVLWLIETTMNAPIKAINMLTDVINKIPGINLGKLPTFKLPRLAKGGIINMPGRGVNYGGANIGERRPEGVIPLSDSQQMSLLGEAIGKYITINANIISTMNGRVISRELRKVQNDSDFAFNK